MIVLEHLDHVTLPVSHRCLLRSRLAAAPSLVPLVGRDLAVAGVLVAGAEGVLRLRGAAQALLIALHPAGLAARRAFPRLPRCRLGVARLAVDGVLHPVLLFLVHHCLLRSVLRGGYPAAAGRYANPGSRRRCAGRRTEVPGAGSTSASAIAPVAKA